MDCYYPLNPPKINKNGALNGLKNLNIKRNQTGYTNLRRIQRFQAVNFFETCSTKLYKKESDTVSDRFDILQHRKSTKPKIVLRNRAKSSNITGENWTLRNSKKIDFIFIKILNIFWKLKLSIIKNHKKFYNFIKNQFQLTYNIFTNQTANYFDYYCVHQNQLHKFRYQQEDMHAMFADILVDDQKINLTGITVIMLYLSNENIEFYQYKTNDIISIIIATKHLQIDGLFLEAVQHVKNLLISNNFISFHSLVEQYNLEDTLKRVCDEWLYLNLIPKLSKTMILKELSSSYLIEILSNEKLFTFNEFCICKILFYWIFFQINQKCSSFPNYNIVVTFFNSLNQNECIYKRKEYKILKILNYVRLHGIIYPSDLNDIQMIKIFDPETVNKIIFSQYNMFWNGGDMLNLLGNEKSSVRFGYIIENTEKVFSEIVSLHGYYFHLFTNEIISNHNCQFTLKRIHPNAPILSFKQRERETSSLRIDREVIYNIRLQTLKNNTLITQNSGFHFGRFTTSMACDSIKV
ncbi:BTB/POZ domain-containing protein 16 [Intoshia linei]|uniref:BTB/POZ domain-containing protein 16 n=1 Tax=Intoshia linei TaxID=1819745 RepID=A0A177B985_9BILA|nr:BTB/POZ domain-containing protein 16 [Intoshia linei]